MITDGVLNDLKRTMLPGTEIPYSYICSWAVFGQAAAPRTPIDASDIGFPTTQTDELLKTLHTEMVLVGLNPGSAAEGQRSDWTAFHFGGKHRDDRLAEACRTTALWGCLMTDLFPLIIDSKSADVTKALRDSKDAPVGKKANYDLQANIDAFEKSLTLAGVSNHAKVTLICVGTDVETWAKRLLQHGGRDWNCRPKSDRTYTVVRVPHYSDQNRDFNGIETGRKASEYAEWVKSRLGEVP